MMTLTFITTNQLYIYTHTYYKHIFKNKQKNQGLKESKITKAHCHSVA